MLLEMTIRNFAVIRDTRIQFAPGLNALTGETGAGKSIVIDALGAVLGARTSAEFVRTGTAGAYVEAVFDLDRIPDTVSLYEKLVELGIEHDPSEVLVLARDINASGRSTARISNRTVTASALAAVGELLVDIHGQSDHLSLLRPAAQLDMLDRFAGTYPMRKQVSDAFQYWQGLTRRIHDFDDEQRLTAQRLDLLRFQSEELGNADIQPGEDERLQAERFVLTNADRLLRAATEADAALMGDANVAIAEAGAIDRIRSAIRAVEEVARLDATVEPLQTRLMDALYTLEDISSELREYAERTELDPARLELIDDRLDQLRNLKRKFGPELVDVIEHAERIQQEIELLEGAEHDIEALRDAETRQRAMLAVLGGDLSNRRRSAAGDLAQRVEQAIGELNMGHADFEVRFDVVSDAYGIAGPNEQRVAIDATGIDRVAFYLAANTGEELRPLARVASGGETARIMLALKSILSEADETPVLVFDEIDVGVGGRSGQVVGEKLWSLTDHHQAIVISHLPQIAAFADRHLTLVKGEENSRAVTTAHEITGAARVEELAMMLDGMPVSPATLASATALLGRVNEWKTSAQAQASKPKPRKRATKKVRAINTDEV